MNKKITSLLVTGALVFVAPVFAQSGSQSGSSSTPGSGSSGSPRQTDRSSPSSTMPSSDTSTSTRSTTTPSSDTSTSTTSGAANSSNANANADLNASAGFYGPGASQFKNIDTDADGRISRAEFTTSASTAASLTQSPGTTDSTTAARADQNAGKTEKKHWWSRSSKSASDDTDPSETFTKLDTDNDGFLSQNELANANSKLKK